MACLIGLDATCPFSHITASFRQYDAVIKYRGTLTSPEMAVGSVKLQVPMRQGVLGPGRGSPGRFPNLEGPDDPHWPMAASKPGCSCPRGSTCSWSPAAPSLSLSTGGWSTEYTRRVPCKRPLARAKAPPPAAAAAVRHLSLHPLSTSFRSHRQRETLRSLPDPDPSLSPASFPSPTYPGKGPPAPPRKPSTGHLKPLRCALLARHTTSGPGTLPRILSRFPPFRGTHEPSFLSLFLRVLRPVTRS